MVLAQNDQLILSGTYHGVLRVHDLKGGKLNKRKFHQHPQGINFSIHEFQPGSYHQ